ncbi:glycoside hydrolase family 127 protein [Auraticoccus sp. F435]|uniref:Glycoside hydrolase family 127 protein n=1 Tax=Auraticoccus cholistanensis TaxID=2656650 RepID=A0A6A9URQ5_9ACTN|nr:glycoside hydrolase family 127 protein [Auraticoccus cholistanensis]
MQRPVARAVVTGGLWHHWQQLNRTASIPLGIAKLSEAGNLTNLRLAAGEPLEATHQGPVYMDSDVYKMLETVAFELERGDDDALTAFVDEACALVAAAQAEDGYLNSYYQVRAPGERYQNLTNSHELYTAGHLFQAAVALARTTGDQRLLDIARRLADHLVEVFLVQRLPRLDGHPQVETALVELYRCVGVPEYLELARRLVEDRGRGLVGSHPAGRLYQQDAFPVREMTVVTGHAVRAMYLEAGIVDLYLETGDRSLLETSQARWENLVAARTALTGGHGARQLKEAFGEDYELPPDQSYNETCAAVASIHWSWRLLLATGEARYADLVERTLHNVFAASVSADGLEFFKGNPLQRRADHALSVGDPRWRDGWFWSACCPPNVTRLMSSLQHYLATTSGSTLSLQLYGDARIGAVLPVGEVDLAVSTALPWDGSTRVRVESAPGAEWTLALRVPSWSPRPEVRLDGQPLEVAPDEAGYLRITRRWRPGEEVGVAFDVSPRLTTPHPRVDAVRGCLALERGPLVYCFEQADQPDGVDVEQLRLTGDAASVAVERRELDGIGATVTLTVDAEELVDAPRSGLPYYPGERSWTTRPVRATAVPYFQWANRDRRAMRVWVPGPAAPAAGGAQRS